MNAVLQALFHVPNFKKWLFSQYPSNGKCNHNKTECFLCTVAKTLQSTLQNSGSSIRPTDIHCKLKFVCPTMSFYRQEDAHEYLVSLMNKLKDSYSKNYSEIISSPIGDIFGGTFETVAKVGQCDKCKLPTTLISQSYFEEITIPISNKKSVQDALQDFFATENIPDFKC